MKKYRSMLLAAVTLLCTACSDSSQSATGNDVEELTIPAQAAIGTMRMGGGTNAALILPDGLGELTVALSNNDLRVRQLEASGSRQFADRPFMGKFQLPASSSPQLLSNTESASVGLGGSTRILHREVVDGRIYQIVALTEASSRTKRPLGILLLRDGVPMAQADFSASGERTTIFGKGRYVSRISLFNAQGEANVVSLIDAPSAYSTVSASASAITAVGPLVAGYTAAIEDCGGGLENLLGTSQFANIGGEECACGWERFRLGVASTAVVVTGTAMDIAVTAAIVAPTPITLAAALATTGAWLLAVDLYAVRLEEWDECEHGNGAPPPQQ